MQKIMAVMASLLLIISLFFIGAKPAGALCLTDWSCVCDDHENGECVSFHCVCDGDTSQECNVCDPGWFCLPNGSCRETGTPGANNPNSAPTIYGPNCPGGTVRDTTQLVNSQCANQGDLTWMETGQRYVPGSSQSYATAATNPSNWCCHFSHIPASDCYEKYKPAYDTWETVCDSPAETICTNTRFNTYACKPVCTATAPAKPVLTSPTSGLTVSGPDVTLAWNDLSPSQWGKACTTPGNRYMLNVRDSAGHNVAPPTQISYTSPATTGILRNAVKGETYTWTVTATNGQLSTTSDPSTFMLNDDRIMGTVYDDVNGDCVVSPGTSDRWDKGAGIIASLGGTPYSSTVANIPNNGGTGVFTITAPVGVTYPTLSLSNITPGYTCSSGPLCGSNCLTLNSISSPSTGHKFYLTQKRTPWWQTVGAGIYVGADGIALNSELPVGKHLIEAAPSGAIGALLRAGNGVPGLGLGTLSVPLYTTQTTYNDGKINYDYDFFAKQLGVLPSQSTGWSSVLAQTNCDPLQPLCYGPAATISTDWHVTNTQKYIVLVNGDLRIDANITVDPGGFVGFIVKGNITVSSDPTTMEGLYVMNGNFATEKKSSGPDAQLSVGGSVVAWGSVTLLRDLGNSNITLPAEQFTYRPDLLTNMPDSMKVFALRWQEVVPGTF